MNKQILLLVITFQLIGCLQTIDPQDQTCIAPEEWKEESIKMQSFEVEQYLVGNWVLFCTTDQVNGNVHYDEPLWELTFAPGRFVKVVNHENGMVQSSTYSIVDTDGFKEMELREHVLGAGGPIRISGDYLMLGYGYLDASDYTYYRK